ncbi:MAG: hypothetical protein ACRCTE_13635 [Cellulosilyticaceae bacterium]
MKKIRLITGMCLTLGVSMIWVTPVFATELTKPPVVTTPNKVAVPKTLDKEAKTTDTAIKFEQDEYIRVTQPLNKDDAKTFERQLNVMGEARTNTQITITVYYEKSELRVAQGKPVSKTYEMVEVGATQSFNQLIDLEVGKNKIILKYVSGEEVDSCEFYITRQSEAEKEQLKNFIANSAAPFKQ